MRRGGTARQALRHGQGEERSRHRRTGKPELPAAAPGSPEQDVKADAGEDAEREIEQENDSRRGAQAFQPRNEFMEDPIPERNVLTLHPQGRTQEDHAGDDGHRREIERGEALQRSRDPAAPAEGGGHGHTGQQGDPRPDVGQTFRIARVPALRNPGIGI